MDIQYLILFHILRLVNRNKKCLGWTVRTVDWVEVYSDYLLSNKPRHSLALRTTHDITLISQLETLI